MTEEKRNIFIEEEDRRLNVLGIPTAPSYNIYHACFADDTQFRAIPFFGDHCRLYRDYGFDNQTPFYDAVTSLEDAYGCWVYAAIYNRYEELGDMLTLLTISGNKAEWQRERRDLEAMMPIAYVQNLTYPELSEWGTVVLKTHDGIVERVG